MLVEFLVAGYILCIFGTSPVRFHSTLFRNLMTDAQLLQEFEALAERLDIQVCREDLDGRSGGLCIFRGERLLILDCSLDVRTQVEVFARELARLPLDDLYILPRVRDRIDAYRETQV